MRKPFRRSELLLPAKFSSGLPADRLKARVVSQPAALMASNALHRAIRTENLIRIFPAEPAEV
jgi:hypothetical protein